MAEEVTSRDCSQDFTSKAGLLGKLQLQKTWENKFSSTYYLYWKLVTGRNLVTTTLLPGVHRLKAQNQTGLRCCWKAGAGVAPQLWQGVISFWFKPGTAHGCKTTLTLEGVTAVPQHSGTECVTTSTSRGTQLQETIRQKVTPLSY